MNSDTTRLTVDAEGHYRWDGDLLPTVAEHFAAAYLALNVAAWRAAEARKERKKREATG